jgi:maltodextrin utilization protein YvdJ
MNDKYDFSLSKQTTTEQKTRYDMTFRWFMLLFVFVLLFYNYKNSVDVMFTVAVRVRRMDTYYYTDFDWLVQAGFLPRRA